MTGLNDVLGAVRRHIVLIVVIAALAGGITLAVSRNDQPTYSASTRFAITPTEQLLSGEQADLVESVAALDRPIVNATFSELLQSGMVAEAAAGAINLPIGELDEYEFSASEVAGAAVVRLVVTGPDATTTQALVQAVRDAEAPMLVNFVGGFEAQSIDETTVHVGQIGPTPAKDALAVALASAILSIVLIVAVSAGKAPSAADDSGPRTSGPPIRRWRRRVRTRPVERRRVGVSARRRTIHPAADAATSAREQ